jgi:polygalacturonase
LQRAIDATTKAGGGTVLVPQGKYLIARLELKSNVTLRLDKNAMLLGSTNKTDYAGKMGVVIFSSEAEHIAIEGEGAINGQATSDFGPRYGAPDKPEFRTSLIRFEKCSDVRIANVSLLYSDSWTLHLRNCEKVRVENISIRNNYKRLNSDGIDPNSCRDVKITHCHITTGDDAIVLKSTDAIPCEDIEVSDCVLESATAALKIGTESKGDFRNIRFQNCKITNSPVGVGVFVKDGATVKNMVAENIDMVLCQPTYHAVVPLYIDVEKRDANSKIGAVRDVTFRNINITSGSGLLLQGMPESWLQDVTLDNITFNVKSPQDYAKRTKPKGGRNTIKDERDTKFIQASTYAAVANVKNLAVEGLHLKITDDAFKQFPRSALSLFNINGAKLSHITREATGKPPAVEQINCTGVVTTQFPAKPDTSSTPQ